MAGLYSASFSWQTPPSVIKTGLTKYGQNLIAMLNGLVGYYAAAIENWAKQNAPWTDRTGHARQSLVATSSVDNSGAGGATVGTITLASGAEYGIWLELAHAGKWGIIAKALAQYENEIIQAVTAALA